MRNATHPLAINDRGEAVAELQQGLIDLGFTVPEQEREAHVFGVGTEDALLSFQSKSSLRRTGIADEDTEAALTRALGIVASGHQVEGRIFSEQGVPAKEVTVRFYNRGFGGAADVIGEAITDDQGFYTLSYDPQGRAANLEVRIVAPDGEELSLSNTRFNADRYELLSLVAPASALRLAAEYDRLCEDLGHHLGEKNARTRLRDAEENGERQDLTLLHQATGWDARLIALAATADQLSDDTRIASAAAYALCRAGLPTNTDLLARVPVAAVRKALDKAVEAGIVQLDAEQIAAVEERFQVFARETRRQERAPGALSRFGELLDSSGLEPREAELFEGLYFASQEPGVDLWTQAREQGLSDASINRLRLQGKLACLTFNNAELAASLQSDLDSPDDLTPLVDLDLDRAETWKERLRGLGDRDREEALDDLIPPAYQGETPADRLDAYAADLARKVRVSFPTQVVRRLVERGDLSLGDGRQAGVATFLKNAADRGFELGRTRLSAFVEQNLDKVLPDMTSAERTATVKEITRLQCLYQITPSNKSLIAIAELGFASADDVAAFAPEEFWERFGAAFPSRDEARLVHEKAQQVTSVIYNFCTMAQQIASTPPTYVTSPSASQVTEAKNNLIKHYPSLETLFGSLDFCDCEHCRSVLSPAAYFVDLLQFLDPKQSVWDSFIKAWKRKYNEVAYPFKDKAAYDNFVENWNKTSKDPVPVDKTPYAILIAHRADLPHIQLTCENTQTALPYIDVVNEILEYYVAHGKLAAGAAHDTGRDVTTAELLAEPQNVLSAAYDTLKMACYPLKLPFDLWLETARRFFDHFDTPLWQVLDLLRPTEKLFDTTVAYDREAVFGEYLGLSPAQSALFADTDPLHWHLLFGYSEQAGVLKALTCAKTLSRRLDLSYKELVDLVQTSFVNPGLADLALVWKLGLEIGDVVQYFTDQGTPGYAAEQQAFEQRLGALDTNYQLQAGSTKKALEGLWETGKFKDTLVLKDTSGLCDFGETYLRFVDGKDADALVLLKINLFVRLWKALGWSMEETDRALQVFLPKSLLPLNSADLGEALQTALIYLAHLKALGEKVEVGKNSRLKLLTLWSDLPTTGKQSLYAQLFLTPSVLKEDPAFDDPLGKYLSDSTRLLADHLGTLQGALNPTADDIRRILLDVDIDIAPLFSLTWSDLEGVLADGAPPKALQTACKGKGVSLSTSAVVKTEIQDAKWRITDGQKQYVLTKTGATLLFYDAADAPKLTLKNVSLLYRYGLLSAGLNLSIRDLIRLKGLSGLDPFKPICKTALAVITDDYPLTQTLHFVEVAEKVKRSGFAVEDLEYLIRHRFDSTGDYRTSTEPPFGVINTLAAGLRSIDAELAVPVDADSITDDRLQQELALVLSSDVAQQFFAMVKGTVVYEASEAEVLDANKLDPKSLAKFPAVQVSYDKQEKTQRLRYLGVLTDTAKIVLTAAIPSEVLKDLLARVQKAAKTFFDKHLIGFFIAADFDLLFGAGLTDAEKRKKITDAFLPYLRRKLSRQLTVQTLAADLKADASLVEALLTDPGEASGYLVPVGQPERLLSDPSDPSDPSKPILDAFVTANTQGLTAAFYGSDDKLIETIHLDAADTGAKTATGTVIKPAKTSSAHLDGWIEVATTGTYCFLLALTPGAEAELGFEHLPDPLVRGKADTQAKATTELSGYLELKAGVPYRLTLDARNLDTSDVAVLVQGADMAKDALSKLRLYPAAAVERVQRAWISLAKALQLVQGLDLSERELRHFVTYRADFNNLDLSKLPTRTADDTATKAKALFGQFLRLADYAALKRDLSAGADDLIAIFEQARRNVPATAASQAKEKEKALLKDLCTRVASLTRRSSDMVQATAEHLGFATKSSSDGKTLSVLAPDFTHERGLERLWKVLQLIERLGVSADTLAGWTAIVGGTTPDTRRAEIAGELKNTIKSRYTPESWQRIAQSIFDELRRLQRDALVAHVMHEEGFERMEELFEYFLIDPRMEPIVQTSRIQLAISSVQLFVQRSLLNLEPLVDPSAINGKHWQWMKRYRVWEANRKIFLFPENWLEPEFRDDKSHLFEEMESALLQGDVSNDLAEEVLFNYLSKLERLARLEIVTMYCQEQPLSPESNTLHVIGRTENQPHEYFYRRYAQQMWTPWEPVTTEIEGDHVVAAFWRDRLHLFWVTFIDKAEKTQNSGSDESNKNTDPTLAKATLTELTTAASAASKRSVEVKLSWSEYFQGEWKTPEATGFNDPLRVIVGGIDKEFDKSKIFVFVTEDEQESAVTINLVGPNFFYGIKQGVMSTAMIEINATALRLMSKNSPPVIWPVATLPGIPYSAGSLYLSAEVTGYKKGQDALKVNFKEKLVAENGKQSQTQSQESSILRKGAGVPRLDHFSLLTCSNVLRSFPDEIGMLVSPLFYQNHWHTFFVEPSLTETKVVDWKEYVISPTLPDPILLEDAWWKEIPLKPEVPLRKLPLPGAVGPLARYKIEIGQDWVTDPTTVLDYKGQLIGKGGAVLPEGRAEGSAGGRPSVATDVREGNGRRMIGSNGLRPADLASLKSPVR